jgi:DNA repair protein RecN (Recombination protein N)
MPRTRCEVQFNEGELPEGEWSARGIDVAQFYLSPNPGEELRPLARIASGGELSRIMLALRTIGSASAAPGKTMIFDEVDSGIGGEVANVVGARLRELGGRYQVLCITHLPQIASSAATHFRIVKTVRKDRAVTTAEPIAGRDRVEEIGRMIGGRVTPSVLQSAAEMLAARGGESKAPAKGESERAKGETAKGAKFAERTENTPGRNRTQGERRG